MPKRLQHRVVYFRTVMSVGACSGLVCVILCRLVFCTSVVKSQYVKVKEISMTPWGLETPEGQQTMRETTAINIQIHMKDGLCIDWHRVLYFLTICQLSFANISVTYLDRVVKKNTNRGLFKELQRKCVVSAFLYRTIEWSISIMHNIAQNNMNSLWL